MESSHRDGSVGHTNPYKHTCTATHTHTHVLLYLHTHMYIYIYTKYSHIQYIFVINPRPCTCRLEWRGTVFILCVCLLEKFQRTYEHWHFENTTVTTGSC